MRADDVEFGEPCPIDLTERVERTEGESFHCDHCDRQVHVLSHMSEAAAAELLARRKREHLCVAFVRRPDGNVHFRGAEQVVPSSRLRRMVRASALALSMAACGGEEDAGGGAVVGGPPPSWDDRRRSQLNDSELSDPQPQTDQDPAAVDPAAVDPNSQAHDVVGGPPPTQDPSDRELRVSFAKLRPISAPEPRRELIAELFAEFGVEAQELILEYCVDEHGKIAGPIQFSIENPEVVAIYRTRMAKWRFEPYQVDGRAVRVCTKQRIVLPKVDKPPA